MSCERDLEGIVAKWRNGTYQCDGRGASWVKICPQDQVGVIGASGSLQDPADLSVPLEKVAFESTEGREAPETRPRRGTGGWPACIR